MTASLIDPAAVAAILANPRRPQFVDEAPVDSALSFARAARLTDREWRRAWSGAMDVLNPCVEEARTRTDGTEIAAILLNRTMNLMAYALTEFAGASADPRRKVRTKTDQVLKVTWEGMSRAIAAGVDEYAGEVHTQMTAAADAAAREATDARRLLDAASAQLTREREEAAREIARLNALLTSERSATVNRERTTRNELHQLRQDHAAQASVIAHLNAECERLEHLLETATAPEVTPMEPQNARERASLHVYLNANAGGSLAQWRAAHPSPAAMVQQLRVAILPLLGRAA